MYISEYHDMFNTEDSMWWYKGLRDILSYYINSVNKSGAAILDAGCGTGKTMSFFLKKGFKMQGIDASPEALKYCKQRGLKRIQKASITDITFSKNTFDIVINMDVLGALPKDADISKAVAEFYRVLKPGGTLIVQCAALEYLRSQHDVVTGFRKRFDKKELESYFKKTKWSILKSSYRVTLLFPIVATVKIIKRFLKTKEYSTDQGVPHPILNEILTRIQILENRIFRTSDFPIGSSLFIVLQKK